jgi:hypothetical protein
MPHKKIKPCNQVALRFVDLGFSVVFVFFLPSLRFLIELRNVGELHFL